MTRRQKKTLLRKAKMAVVIGAELYLAIGISTLGKQSDVQPDRLNEMPVSIQEVSDEEVTEIETQVVTATAQQIRESAPKAEYHSIIYSKDWDAEESELLCKIAMAEAGNQDTEGKALVMLVVLNRVWGDNEFPNTIKDVIYQPRQFSPVLEGTFEATEPDEDCWKALEMVERGWDESQGALYFESKSASTWHEDNLKFLFKHGDHYFYTERD